MRRIPLAALILAVAVPTAALAGAGAASVTMSVRPTILRPNETATAGGVVAGAKPDQLVTVQSRPCDQTSWRDVAETTTHEDGGWSVQFQPGISGAVRAVSGGTASEPVEVKQRPFVGLTMRPPGTFSVWVNAQRSFWRKRVSVQRFDARRRAWVDVRSVLLTSSGAPPGVPWVVSDAERFRLKVPKGTLLRATLPLAQARPCYLGGYSTMVRR